MTTTQRSRRAPKNQPPAGGILTAQRLEDPKFMNYYREVRIALGPRSARERDLVDRFIDLAWKRKDLEEELSELQATPMASMDEVESLKRQIDAALERVILTARELSRVQNAPILLVIPRVEPGEEALPVATMHVQ